MDVKNLETFVMVNELKSFTLAAGRLGYTQSTVSFQIKQLEKELSIPLFERIGHTVTLTNEGEKLLPLAQRSHEMNQRRMHTGVIWLFVLPVLLYIIRNLTDSSKIAFLILWIVGMFLIAAFLVMVAYQDDELQKNLDELQDYVPDAEETKLGKLMLVSPESNRWMEESTGQLLRRVEALTAKRPGREEAPDA